MTIEELINHDCHTSPEDGCKTCEDAKNDKVCEECNGDKEIAFKVNDEETLYQECLECRGDTYSNDL